VSDRLLLGFLLELGRFTIDTSCQQLSGEIGSDDDGAKAKTCKYDQTRDDRCLYDVLIGGQFVSL